MKVAIRGGVFALALTLAGASLGQSRVIVVPEGTDAAGYPGEVRMTNYFDSAGISERKITAREKELLASRMRAVSRALAAQPQLQPPKGFDALFSESLDAGLYNDMPDWSPLRLRFLFFGFDLRPFTRKGANGAVEHILRSDAADYQSSFWVNRMPDEGDRPQGIPALDVEGSKQRAHVRPERTGTLQGFPVFGNEVYVTRLDIDTFWKPASVQAVLGPMRRSLQVAVNQRRERIDADAARVRRQRTPDFLARQAERREQEVRRVESDRGRSEGQRAAYLGATRKQWADDDALAEATMAGDPEGPVGKSYREARDTLAELDKRLAALSAEQLASQACYVKDDKVRTERRFTLVLTAEEGRRPGVQCSPLSLVNYEALRRDLPRTAIQLITLPAGLPKGCQPVGEANGVPVFRQQPGCLNLARLVTNLDLQRVAALLE